MSTQIIRSRNSEYEKGYRDAVGVYDAVRYRGLNQERAMIVTQQMWKDRLTCQQAAFQKEEYIQAMLDSNVSAQKFLQRKGAFDSNPNSAPPPEISPDEIVQETHTDIFSAVGGEDIYARRRRQMVRSTGQGGEAQDFLGEEGEEMNSGGNPDSFDDMAGNIYAKRKEQVT